MVDQGDEVGYKRFRQLSVDLFRLCESWLCAAISSEEFQKQCVKDGPSLHVKKQDRERILHLSNEFEDAIGCTLYVEKAIADLRSDGFGNEPTAAVRAVYFAKQVKVVRHVIALEQCLHEQ